MDKRLTRSSKKLSRLLRHRAADVGLAMDPAGWVAIADVLAHISLSRAELDQVVAKNDKRRLQVEGERIRCCQGHSVGTVPISLAALEGSWERVKSAAPLWHGTYGGALESIGREGICPRARTHVHLTDGLESRVGKRANVDVALEVDPGRVRSEGVGIFRAPNGVILARRIPRRAIVDVVPMTRRAESRVSELRARLGLD